MLMLMMVMMMMMMIMMMIINIIIIDIFFILEADLLCMVCNDVKIEPQLQDVTGEQLSSGSNLIFMPLASESNINLHLLIFVFVIPMQSHTSSWNHDNEKKRTYSRSVLDI